MLHRLIMVSLLTVFLTLACSQQDKETQSNIIQEVPETNGLVQYFMTTHPGETIIKYAYQDLNDDGRQDLLIIYQVGKEKNMMCVILDLGEKYVATNEVPAPISNQFIQFKDIDDKPPMEFIVHGSKGAKVGYAIFRIERGQIVDLFGEGMADCC